jgi:hypothetical protein
VQRDDRGSVRETRLVECFTKGGLAPQLLEPRRIECSLVWFDPTAASVQYVA